MAETDAGPVASLDARRGVQRLWGVLIVLAVSIFGLLISIGCYFSALGLRVLACVVLLIWVGWIVAVVRWLKRNHYVVATRQGRRTLGLVSRGFYALGLSMLATGWSWLVLYSVAALLVFATSRTPMQVASTLDVAHTGGRCPVSYTFDNPPIGRSIHECGLPYREARSGDRIVLIESLGPWGVRFDHIERMMH